MFRSVHLFALSFALATQGTWAQAGEGIGVMIRNTCSTWQRVSAGLVGGPAPITLDIPRNQTVAHLLCDAPWACGYEEDTWNTPKAHWLDLQVETQGSRQVYETLTSSSTGGMASYFVVDLCPSPL